MKSISRTLSRFFSSEKFVEEENAGLFNRNYILHISFAGLLASTILLIIALGWIFAFGVIIGRGYNPEEKMPTFAQMLPKQDEDTEKKADTVLKAEELTFMRDLKQKGYDVTPVAPLSPLTATKEDNPPSGSAEPPSTPAEKVEPEKIIEPPVQNYNFVFQVAAFRRSEQAEILRKKLQVQNLRTKITIENDKDGKPYWYRVQVLFRGSQEETSKALDIFQKLKIKDARIVSKTPVNLKGGG